MSNSKDTSKLLHIYTDKGGVLAQYVGGIESARRIAEKYARKNAGQAAHIFGVIESHVSQVSPPEVVKGFWALPKEE